MPTYGAFVVLWWSTLSWLPERTRLLALLWTFVITGLLPMLFIGMMRLFGTVTDIGLNIRGQRPVPLLFTAVCYGSCGYYFIRLHAPEWFSLFFFGAMLVTVITAIVSFRWKISGHAAGVGALVALVVRLIGTGQCVLTEPLALLLGAIAVAGLTGTSRILLDRHSPSQVWAGYVNGVAGIMLVSELFAE